MNKLSKYAVVISASGALLLSGGLVLALETSVQSDSVMPRTSTQNLLQAKQDAQLRMEQMRKELEAKKEEIRHNIEARTQTVKQGVIELKDLQKKKLEALKEEAAGRAKEMTEKLKEIRQTAEEKIKKAKEEGKARVQEVKDRKKREAADKIVAQLDRINKNWTDHFTNVLNRLDEVLVKIKSRSEKAAANGTDVSHVTTAITDAEAKIAAARTTVAAQAQKTYVLNTNGLVDPVNVTTSTTAEQTALVEGLRTQFKVLKEQLHTDLTALRDGAMKDARTAVTNIMPTLSSVPKVNDELHEDAITQ